MVTRLLVTLLCLGMLHTLMGCYVAPVPYRYYAPRPYAAVYVHPYGYVYP